MSTDEKVTKSLIRTLEDGKKGFTDAAERLAGSDRPDLAATFREFAEQRARFSNELRSMAASYGDDIDESGSLSAAAHRGWMAVKDALAGADPDGVLDAAEQGEDHAVSEYESALDTDDVSAELRQVVQRQFTEVKRAHDTVRSLRDAAKS
ncbi:MAG: PA2169 family four-helix-bundle protein [Acidimicrobiales bacterium]